MTFSHLANAIVVRSKAELEWEKPGVEGGAPLIHRQTEADVAYSARAHIPMLREKQIGLSYLY